MEIRTKSVTPISAWKTASKKEELFYNEGGETFEQVAQKTSECPFLEKNYGQVGPGSEQLDKAGTPSLQGTR